MLEDSDWETIDDCENDCENNFPTIDLNCEDWLKSIPKVFGSSTAMEMLSIVKTVKGYSPLSISVELSEKLLIFDMIDFELTILAPCVVDKGLALMRAI